MLMTLSSQKLGTAKINSFLHRVGLLSTEVEFYWKKQQYHILCHPVGDLWVTYTVHLWLVGKHVVDFLLVLIKLFHQFSWLRHYK